MGLQDCPDWLLAEIVVLAKLTSVKQKMLVAGVIKDMCGIPLDYAKVRMLFLETRGHCWGLNYLAPAKYFSPQHCPLGECHLRYNFC